jgi:hypothetical protein
MPKTYTLKALWPLIPMARQKPPLQAILDPLDDGTGLWIVRYVADEHGFWLQVNDEYAGAEVPGQTLSRQGIIGLTGFDVDDLEAKQIDGVKDYFYAMQGGAPLLPIPFTARQFRKFDERAGGIFSSAMCRGGLSPKDLMNKRAIGPPPSDSAVWSPEEWRDFTAEWLTELKKTNPDAEELAHAILSGIELEDDLVADAVNDSMDISGAPARPAVDYTMLATPQQLIDAFHGFTGMDLSWFNNLNDSKLKDCLRVSGISGRKSSPPFFCPYSVMLWLVDEKRKKGRPMTTDTGWRMLKAHFPKVFDARGVGVDSAD